MKQFSGKGTGRGFTLLELVVVLAIMTMLMALLWPNFERLLVNERLSSAMYQLHSDLRLAQSIAQERQESVNVTIYAKANDDGGCYYVMRTINQDHGNVGVKLRTVDLPAGVQAEFWRGDTEVEFFSDGCIAKNGHIMLTTQNKRCYLYFYQTGRMRITDEPN